MCEEFENEKKKEQKDFDLPERGFEVRSPRSNQNKLLKEIGLYQSRQICSKHLRQFFPRNQLSKIDLILNLLFQHSIR